jgi:uncharacterized membrane protein YjjP (DUF1212 family)
VKEVFKHSIRVGQGLMQSWQIKEYSKKYTFWLLFFFLWWILAFLWCIWRGMWWLIPVLMIGVILLLIFLKTLQRTIQEKYASHLVYVPIVMSTRGLWYIYGILKFLITKK